MTALTFLGTGNFLAPGRYWNSFVVDAVATADTNVELGDADDPAVTVLVPRLHRRLRRPQREHHVSRRVDEPLDPQGRGFCHRISCHRSSCHRISCHRCCWVFA